MMKTVGFPISFKENENRRALIPLDLGKIKNVNSLFFEKGYGEVLGYTDNDYLMMGANIVSREEVLMKDVICDPKIGDADYLEKLSNQTLFGWIHAVQNKSIVDIMIKNKLTGYAWEDMYENGRHVFWMNNEIAGEAAVFHAYLCHGVFPYKTKVAVLGRGNVAKGAIKALNYMGAEIVNYDRRTESLFKAEINQYDVIVNAILWDTSRKDHIIYKEDLKKLKRNCMIIDISCDRCGGIESSIPTTIENPSYIVDGIRHYVVDHTPSLFYKSSSESISKEVCKYIDYIIENRENDIIDKCLNIDSGNILDHRICQFQKRITI